VRLGAIEVCENPESEFALTIAAPTFPFVHLDGPNKGEVLHATCMLNSGVGEHPRATPFNPELAVFEDVPRQYGDALPSTPMYTEKIETLVFTTTAQGMWNLFKPFSWQLWIAIVGMVRTPMYCRQAAMTLYWRRRLIDAMRIRAGDLDVCRVPVRHGASENAGGPPPSTVALICKPCGPGACARDHQSRCSHRRAWLLILRPRKTAISPLR
jgi:hypothetical protein